MFYLEILLLAVVQGLAELLPVSSSAHVILAQKLLGRDPSAPDQVFLLLMLHTGTMFAAVVYFWSGWKRLLTGGPPGSGRVFVGRVVLATAATGVLGLGLQFLIERVVLEKMLGHEKGEVESLFRSLPLIGAALLAAGVVIVAAAPFDRADQKGDLTGRSSLWVGLVQGLCLPFRGFSRSGATISVGLFCGLPRRLAEEFSFALAVVLTPPLIVRQAWKLRSDPRTAGADLAALVAPGLLGMVFAFLAGLVALKLLSAVLERGRWGWFGAYCFAFAAVLFVAARAGV
jgi:undecaprenyl-diphosphatase